MGMMVGICVMAGKLQFAVFRPSLIFQIRFQAAISIFKTGTLYMSDGQKCKFNFPGIIRISDKG